MVVLGKEDRIIQMVNDCRFIRFKLDGLFAKWTVRHVSMTEGVVLIRRMAGSNRIHGSKCFSSQGNLVHLIGSSFHLIHYVPKTSNLKKQRTDQQMTVQKCIWSVCLEIWSLNISSANEGRLAWVGRIYPSESFSSQGN